MEQRPLQRGRPIARRKLDDGHEIQPRPLENRQGTLKRRVGVGIDALLDQGQKLLLRGGILVIHRAHHKAHAEHRQKIGLGTGGQMDIAPLKLGKEKGPVHQP